MMWQRNLILWLALSGLVSCGEVVPSECAGWEKISVAETSAEYLAANDPRALEEIIAHAEFGRKMNCWK